MAQKAKTAKEVKPLKMDQKTFLKLMAKRERLDKIIKRNTTKLAAIDIHLAMFADWLKNLTTTK